MSEIKSEDTGRGSPAHVSALEAHISALESEIDRLSGELQAALDRDATDQEVGTPKITITRTSLLVQWDANHE